MKEVHTVAKMGRPRAESPKKKNVSFRLTEKEYQKLSEYAAKHELTTTQAIQKGIDRSFISDARKVTQGLLATIRKEL